MKMKYGSKGNGGSMSSPKGMYSHKKNPMRSPRQVPVGLGANPNPDARKANKLLMKAQSQIDSLRGESGC